MVELIDSLIVASAHDVWTTMLRWPPKPAPPAANHGQPGTFELKTLNGCIGFAGRLTGSIFFSCDQEAATAMARVILGQDGPIEIRDVTDVVGELTNMLAGGCVSRLRNKGFTVDMSIPNIIRGTGIQAASKSVAFMVQRSFEAAGKPNGACITMMGKID